MPDEKQPESSAEAGTEEILAEIRPDFIETGARRIRAEDVGRLVEHADRILAEFDSSGTLRRYADDAAAMVALVRDHFTGDYLAAPYWTIAVITFTLAYVLKPIDIIPDCLPVIGQLDDALVFGHGLEMVKTELVAYRASAPGPDQRP